MAWRDSRHSRRRLFLFVSSITLGVAALVAISSFSSNLERAVEGQAKTLLGADLVVSSREPFTEEMEELLSTIEGESSRQINTSTMAFFPRTSDTRLVQVRALKGAFPYYGELETTPQTAGRGFQDGDFALVDRGLMIQFGVEVGERVRIGRVTFEILGSLDNIPGEAAAAAIVGPRVYIPYQSMERTDLIQVGSRAGYRIFYKLPSDVDAVELEAGMKDRLRELRLGSDTVDERKEDLGEALSNLYGFLNLVGFVALLLGGIGVASSIHLYLKQKIPTIAVLRCLGAASGQTFMVYLLQSVALGFVGAALGSLIGRGVQFLLPQVLSDFLPVEIDFVISWEALVLGTLLGVVVTLLFALLPLLPVRKITPLLTLRADFEPGSSARDRMRGLVFLAIGVAVLVFAMQNTEEWWAGVVFFIGVAVVFGLLAGIAKLVMVGLRRHFPRSFNYVVRQGLANLYRPHNQTLVLMLALGLGTFLILTLFLVQDSLLDQVTVAADENRPNLVFFDIQSDQLEEVVEVVRSLELPLLQNVPIVTMRLSSVKGRDVKEILEDRNRGEGRGRGRWAYRREYRSTYRDHLTDAEKLVGGEWIGSVTSLDESVPISLEQGIAENLDVDIGDELVFDVQGFPVKAHVASYRTIDWKRIQPGFFVLFPAGVLEEAPQFHVIVSRAESVETSAVAQRTVVARFPNISAIDLALILNTVDTILDKVSFAIRFMALFSVITGLTVLAGAVLTGRYQRIRESVLLRTLGASRKQVRRILLVEYLFLGSLAASTGLVLALSAGWALARFVFEVPFLPSPYPVFGSLIVLSGLTVLIGMFNSRGICDRPPLEVLRAEQ